MSDATPPLTCRPAFERYTVVAECVLRKTGGRACETIRARRNVRNDSKVITKPEGAVCHCIYDLLPRDGVLHWFSEENKH